MAVRKTAGMKARKRSIGPGKRGKNVGPSAAGLKGRKRSKGIAPPTTVTATGVAGETAPAQPSAPTPAPEVPGFENANGATWAGVPFSDPADTTSNQESTLTTETPEFVSGPTTPPTTYGKPKKVGNGPKKGGSGKLLKRIARKTDGTRSEARGTMRKVRTQVRKGNTAGAKRTLTKSLYGKYRAGKPLPKQSAKATKAATKITKRIDARQTARTTVVKKKK